MTNAWNKFIYGNIIDSDICIPKVIFKIILTIFIPPIGVFYDQYQKGFNAIYNIPVALILTCLFYFPGLIYGFSVIELDYDKL